MKVQASGGLWLPNTSSSEIHLKSFSECTECSNIGTELLWWRKAGPVSYVIDERFTQLFKISVLSVLCLQIFFDLVVCVPKALECFTFLISPH